MEVRATSDLFQHRYYRINVVAMQWTGQWPYQTPRTRFVIGAVAVSIFASIMTPQAIVIVNNYDDWDCLVECVTPFFFGGILFTKFICSSLNSKKMLTLLDRIRMDWNILTRDGDVDILHEYAETGRIMTILYAVGAYSTGVLFSTSSMIPKVIDILLRNGTKPGEFPVPVDYLFIDAQKYYFHLMLHFFVCLSVAFVVLIGHDTLFIVFILHGRGLYAVLGHKLQRIGKRKRSAVTSTTVKYALDQLDFKDLIFCIDRHKETIKYTDVIEDTYSWCLFFVIGFTMCLIIFTGLQVVVTTIGPEETLKFAVSNIVAMILLWGECYLTQTLTDSSIIIRYYILCSEWYRLPLKAQKILLQLIMRCNVSCTITAGKVFVMSMEMFNVVLKTSLSYFSFLRSI